MNVALRLLLCLAALLAGFPPVGMAADRCCAGTAASASHTHAPACGCCCIVKSGEKSKPAVGCCQHEHGSKAAKSAREHEPVASSQPCGQDNCPCSTQTCCAPASLTLVFENSAAAQVQGVSSSTPLQLREDLLQTRGDRPLVPPPKA
ncbi:hypothetical protein [Planctomicrobium piriforme]|uniref:hypothetical protein n=1 Tax=Planctomicrobium piriforme TaxID=1576369 RepID=UPI000B8078C1|nr:hypothetical protein [Planctomicrobium piriforme]